jgi:hypothetical protein
LFRFTESWKKHASKDRDNGNHDEKLDQRESTSSSNSWMSARKGICPFHRFSIVE